MAIAVDPNRTFDYVLKGDRKLPVEQQTVFKLKVLSAKELARLEDNISLMDLNGVMQVKSGSIILETLRIGLRGWDTFHDKNGNLIEFRDNNGKPRDDNFDLLRPEWRRELANAITEQTKLSGDEIKNSGLGQE